MQLGIKPSAPGASASPSEGQSSEEGTYQVGYGRPPLHSRFKPGQSGNPKGRPKQSRNLRTIVKQVSQRANADSRGGPSAPHVCEWKLLVRTSLRARSKGDPKALASLIVLLRQCGL